MRSGIIVSLALAVFLLGACNRNRGYALEPSTKPNPNNSSAPAAPNPAVMPVASYADTVSKATPAVVTIHSQQRVRQPGARVRPGGRQRRRASVGDRSRRAAHRWARHRE